MSKYTVHINRTDSVNVEIEADTREQAEAFAFERFTNGEIEFPPAYNCDNVEITTDPAPKEPPKPAPITFTPLEQYIISEALLRLIRENSNSIDLITSAEAIEALKNHLVFLRDLNSKVCALSESQLSAAFRAQEQPRKTPRVLIEVQDGLVQSVYADADVTVELCDLDSDDTDEYESAESKLRSALDSGDFKEVY